MTLCGYLRVYKAYSWIQRDCMKTHQIKVMKVLGVRGMEVRMRFQERMEINLKSDNLISLSHPYHPSVKQTSLPTPLLVHTRACLIAPPSKTSTAPKQPQNTSR